MDFTKQEISAGNVQGLHKWMVGFRDFAVKTLLEYQGLVADLLKYSHRLFAGLCSDEYLLRKSCVCVCVCVLWLMAHMLNLCNTVIQMFWNELNQQL
jgi:hypothetical protein